MLARWRDSFGHAGLAMSLQRTRHGLSIGWKHVGTHMLANTRQISNISSMSLMLLTVPHGLCREHWIQIDIGERCSR